MQVVALIRESLHDKVIAVTAYWASAASPYVMG